MTPLPPPPSPRSAPAPGNEEDREPPRSAGSDDETIRATPLLWALGLLALLIGLGLGLILSAASLHK